MIESLIMNDDKRSLRQIVLGMAAYTSASILGPLIIFGGFGYFLDKVFNCYPLWTLICLATAFVFTNILLFRKIKKISAIMESYGQQVKAEKNQENQTEKK